MTHTNERVYEVLRANTVCLAHRITRYDLTVFALGYFGHITVPIINAIDRLYSEGVIDT